MKLFSALIIGAFMLCVLVPVAFADGYNGLIILVRHAEKADQTSQDPDLSADGKVRAARLIKAIGRFRPGAFYSTDFKRTRETVEPLAKKRGKAVTIYDARKPAELISLIMNGKIKRSVVSGHSNTIPPLVNLLLKKELFKNLEDAEYSTIWLVRFKDGKPVKAEILSY